MASESRALAPIDEVKTRLADMAPSFKSALPPHVSVEKFVRVVQTAVVANPDLANPDKCDRKSLYGAAMRLAQDGLLPDGREAAIVPYKGKAKDMPMVAGLLKKVRQSGELLSIAAHVVYERDTFDYQLGDDEKIVHKPSLEADRGKPIITYAIAKTKDGGIYREVMTETQVQAVRSVSASKDSGPWAGPFADEMRKKTAIRRLSKRLPMSTDIEELMHRDDDLFMPPQAGEAPDSDAANAGPTAPKDPAGGGAAKRPRALSKVAEQAKQGMGGPTTIDSETGEITGGAASQQQDGPPPGHPAAAPVDVI